MKNTTTLLVSLLCLSIFSIAHLTDAATLELLEPEPADLVATTLSRTQVAEGAAAPTNEPVRMAWALDAQTALAERPGNPFAESRSYWFATTAAELSKGVGIDTTAAGAVVRINPLGHARVSLDPAAFAIIDPSRRVLAADESMEHLVSSEQLARADNPFPEGTAAFRFRSDLGAGRFVLRVPLTGIDASNRFVVHVFEPESDVVATLSLDTGATIEGRPIHATAALGSTGTKTESTSVEAFLIAPNGRRTALVVDADLTTTAVTTSAIAGGELWEIEFRMNGVSTNGHVSRSVRSAFAVAAATARLDGRVEIDNTRGLTASIGVDSATTGRFEIRSVLWGTTTDGAMVPIAVAHSAASIGAGRRMLDLVFDEELLSASNTSAPFELRDLQLIDQTRMGVLHRQARAVIID